MFFLFAICLFINLTTQKKTESASDLFEQFYEKFNKTYQGLEKKARFQIFRQNLEHIQKMNKNSKHAKFSPMTKFADMSKEEFRSQYLLNKHSSRGLAWSCSQYGAVEPPVFTEEDVKALPDAWDWRTTGGKDNSGVVTPVKNQGDCGSCWTFSTTGNIEGLWALKGNPLTSFSEQQIVDCSHACCNMPGEGQVCNQGCNGGFMWSAFYDIMSWGGLETEAEYPYQGYDGTCGMNSSLFQAPIINYTCISSVTAPANEEQMRAYIYQNGPVSIALDAGLLQWYFGGIIDPFFPNIECDPTSLDHGILIVGWGQERNWIGEMTPYWLVKNSWGADWGDSGYFLIARNDNICGIAEAVSSAVM